MAELILITGGARSGKSGFALQLAEASQGERYFFATCPCTDDEMGERIQLHIEERANRNWTTIEEETGLVDALSQCPDDTVIVIDCLTLWVNNLMYHADLQGTSFAEQDVVLLTDLLIDRVGQMKATVIMVSNEVGLGIVPESETGRKYRDFVGRCNQRIGNAADQVYLVCCGIPLQIKG